ncbi:inter-alpha-trypsin inhibitor heavy chain H4 isoform X2 [Leptinotarsa decemlineata]|uniref:inter-alpha-trypsin inhibitor heavy chain H4 isoform X2 n=1 Tax=Leptinotarsa decemlineata TaxID=7539 RepID=UPI003D306375
MCTKMRTKNFVMGMALFIMLQMEASEELQQEEYFVRTYVADRIALTHIDTKVVNTLSKSTRASFCVFLPERAILTGFHMDIDGQRYDSRVVEQILGGEFSEGVVYESVSVRNSFKFGIDVSMEPHSEIHFHLEYEELLQKASGRYQIVSNIIPGSLVENLKIEVFFNETVPVILKDTFFRSGSDFLLRSDVDLGLEIINTPTGFGVLINPDIFTQLELVCSGLRSRSFKGLVGQFVVEYNLENKHEGGLTLFDGNTFITFFSPQALEPIPKHIVFVLDTSGSMWGRRIDQLRNAMKQILPQLLEDDVFDIVEFDSSVYLSQFDSPGNNLRKKVIDHNTPLEHYGSLDDIYLRNMSFSATRATPENIQKAFRSIERMQASEGTNSIGGLEVGLSLVKSVQNKNSVYVPIIIFLTDGQPTVGVMEIRSIVDTITNINQREYKAPIYAISFGVDVDWNFLNSLSWQNGGRAIKIEIARDSAVQLLNFYKEISVPVLRDITFKNLPDSEEVTKSSFPVFFDGSELNVAGKGGSLDKPISTSTRGLSGPLDYHTTQVSVPAGYLEWIWAYLSINQLLDQFYASNDEIFFNKACNLTVQHSFLTEYSSMIVTLPKNLELLLNIEGGVLRNQPKLGKPPQYCSDLPAYFRKHYPNVTPKPKTTTTRKPITTTTEQLSSESEGLVTSTTEETETTTTELYEETTTEQYEETTMDQCVANEDWQITISNKYSDLIRSKDACKLPISLGSCTNYTLQWFYSQRMNKCIQYEYGGCYGNDNRFDTNEECSKCIL